MLGKGKVRYAPRVMKGIRIEPRRIGAITGARKWKNKGVIVSAPRAKHGIIPNTSTRNKVYKGKKNNAFYPVINNNHLEKNIF